MRIFDFIVKRKRVKEKQEMIRKLTKEKDVERLLEMLADESKSIRKEVVTALGEVKAPTTIEHLIAAWMDPDTTAEGKRALANLVGSKAVNLIVAAKVGGVEIEGEISRTTKDILIANPDKFPNIVRFLLVALQHPQLTNGASRSLGRLIDILMKEDPWVRIHTVRMDEIIEVLISALRSDNVYVKTNALIALGKIKGPEASQAVLVTLKNVHEDQSVRISAIWNFVKISPAEARDILAEIVENDPDPKIQNIAEEALEEI